MSATRRPALFLDRDGTLIEERYFLSDPAGVRLLPGTGAALRQARDAGYALVLVSNQSGIARGLFDEATLARVQAELERQLALEGVALDLALYCPHHPTEGSPPYRRACDCRKPAPGLLLQAAERLDLDLARSWVIGDAERDLLAGARAGVPGRVLVLTGVGQQERLRLEQSATVVLFADDLAQALTSFVLRSSPA